ncbi:MAG: hypothetical protein QM679_00390 [Patulibacter sp.]
MAVATPPQWRLPDGHRTADRRSLAMHRLIAERLDQPMLTRAQERVEQWLGDGGPVDRRWATQWRELLHGTPAEVAVRIAADTSQLTQLRQVTPFAGALTPRERWAILRDVW